jgi:hypothetical protein
MGYCPCSDLGICEQRLGGGPTESEWSISCWPSRTCDQRGIGAASSKLVHSVPLNEPDHVIDLRDLLAKSGSPSRRHPMASHHRHQLRSSNVAPKRSTAAIVPPALNKERTHSASPSDLTQEDRHFSATGP